VAPITRRHAGMGGELGDLSKMALMGRQPPSLDADKLAAARARRARDESPAKIAKALGVSRASIYRHLAAESE
jgi:AcrR family transcriptional regulator